MDWVEYRIFKNTTNEAEIVYRMLVEMAEWAYNTDGDMKVYEDDASFEDYVPLTVKTMGYSTGIKFKGDIMNGVPEDVWRVGY